MSYSTGAPADPSRPVGQPQTTPSQQPSTSSPQNSIGDASHLSEALSNRVDSTRQQALNSPVYQPKSSFCFSPAPFVRIESFDDNARARGIRSSVTGRAGLQEINDLLHPAYTIPLVIERSSRLLHEQIPHRQITPSDLLTTMSFSPPPVPPIPIRFDTSSTFGCYACGTPGEGKIQEPPLTFEKLYNPARRKEQQCHFTAVSHAMKSRKTAHSLASLADATSSITTETITSEKSTRLYHLICRLGALDPQFPQETLYEKAQEASHSEATIEQICATLSIKLLPPSLDLITIFREQEHKNAALENPELFAAEKAILTSALFSLEQLLSLHPQETEELEDRNRTILLSLRAIYSSPIYEALCMSQIPLIDVLHSIAIGQYTDATLAPTFEKIGHELQEKQHPLPERIDAIWNKLEKIGVDNGFFTTIFHYSFRLLVKVGIPYLALKIAQLFSLNWLIPHIGDERSILGNTPGALTDEIQTKSILHQRKIRTVVLSAPTMGNDIAPEFRAALQALENNQLSNSDNPFLTWAYTNLQNISFTPERPSTIALMALHNRYPLSFQAITLPQNLTESSTASFSQEDVHHHLSLLFQKCTPALESRGAHADAGYYIPQQFLDSHRAAIEAIADDAYHTIDRCRGSHTAEALKIVFTKLFHLGLTRLHETVALNLTAARTHRTVLSAIRSTICASCVDRGGMMNAATTHALDIDGSLNDLTAGVYYGHALLSHRRSPTKQSAENLSTIFTVVSNVDVRKFLLRVTPEFSSSLLPAA